MNSAFRSRRWLPDPARTQPAHERLREGTGWPFSPSLTGGIASPAGSTIHH
jgi:hypothetical protein